MSLQLSAVLRAARDRHPAFHKSRVPDAVVGRFLSDYQNELIGLAATRAAHYLEQAVSIALDLDSSNAPGTAGAGTAGGVPAEISGGDVNVVQESAGALAEPALTEAQEAAVIVAERVVTAATATTVSSTGAARTVNQDLNRIVLITAGKGAGQVRLIASNTAEQWVVSAAWTTTPDTTSMIQILSSDLIVTEENGIVTEIPALSTRRGYLVKLSAQGVPQIDYTQPISSSVARGVPLPSALALTGGTVRYADSDEAPLTITSFGRRYDPPGFPAVYQLGEEIHFCGLDADWDDVASIEIRYVPIAPEFTALTDYFLVPDAARPCLVAKAAEFMAIRVESMEDITINADAYAARGAEAEVRYLSTLRLSKRARRITFREGSY